MQVQLDRWISLPSNQFTDNHLFHFSFEFTIRGMYMINWIGLIERYIVDSRDVMELVNNLVKIVYKFSYSSASISKQRTNNHLIYTQIRSK